MIVSHKHRFIYIKNRKVGSTSAELFLQKFCGEDDIVTPDHVHRSADDVLLPGARNWQGRAFHLSEFLGSTSLMDAARVVRDGIKRPRFYNHMRATSVRARIGRSVWNSYYKFCFERNPWDKSVSFYYWYGKGKNLPDINTFYQNHKSFGTLDQVFASDWTRYTHRNRIIVDEVMDYDDLFGGIRKALRTVGISEDEIARHGFPNEKSDVRKKKTAVFEPETDAIIRKVFRHEIANLPFCRSPRSPQAPEAT